MNRRILAAACIAGLIALGADDAQSEVISVGVVEPLTGPLSTRGTAILETYRNAINAENDRGGFVVGSQKYKARLVTGDSGSNPTTGLLQCQKLAVEHKVLAILTSDSVCMSATDRMGVPLLLTISTTRPIKGEHTFLLNAPSGEDFRIQAELAIGSLREALKRTRDLEPRRLSEALRSIDFTSDNGSIRFDASGNNVGHVAYPVRASSRPNAAGCSKACASTCPSNCGKNTCNKEGSNECCNICSRPQNR